MRILLTNDDGVQAPGIHALADVLAPMGELEIVAPAQGQSGVGHAITFLRPLRVATVTMPNGHGARSVDGTPADCIKWAVTERLQEVPDLVVSGMNAGANRGVDVLYSGTVAAAAEAALLGIPAIAISVETAASFDFPAAGRWARQVIDQALAIGIPKGQLLNVNIPNPLTGKPKGIRAVPQSLAPWQDAYAQRKDPRGTPYYWLKGGQPRGTPGVVTDLEALAAGWVTVTPLQLDLTASDQLKIWQANL